MSIKKRLLLAVFVVAVIFIFPQTVDAADYDIKSIYYYAFDEYGEAFLDSFEIHFCGAFSNEQKAFILFSMLFENPEEGKICFIPANTRIINVIIESDTVFVNISKEVLRYGGTANENALVKQILKTAASIDDIKFITLLIEYNNICLPEGTEISMYELYE